MQKATIAFFGTMPYDKVTFNKVNEDYGFDIKYYTGILNADNVSLTKGADIVCVFVNDQVDASIIAVLKENGVKMIALRCAGYNNVDLDAAHAAGIIVARVPAYSPHAVAEYAVALMLSLNRKIQRASWRTRDGNFTLNGLMGFDMYGKTIGVIGTGKIAKVLIGIMRGFGTKVLAYDLYPDHAFAEANDMRYVTLDELYAGSDIISLHCPLNEQTRNMIGEAELQRMKPRAVLINVGRGGLVDEHAVMAALKYGQLGGAGFDVLTAEPPREGNPLLARLPNLIVTPHTAWASEEALNTMTRMIEDNIRAFVSGAPTNVIAS